MTVGEQATLDEQPVDRTRWQRIVDRLPRYGWSGTVVAVLLAGASYTPSLLPRAPLLQGLIAGITGAYAYGLGELVAWGVRKATKWRPSAAARRRAWRVLWVVGGAYTLVMLVLGYRWQNDLRALMGMSGGAAVEPVLIVVVGVLVFMGLVAVGRFLRTLTRWVLDRTLRRLPLWLARTVSVTVVVLLVVGFLSGVVFRTFVAVSNALFSVRDTTTAEGVVQPSSPERSGSPESVIPWSTLGYQGRTFVGLGPTQAQIASFSGQPAMQPIRVYAGLQSASTVHDRVQLVVRDLQRAGAFDRKALVVVTTTGTGWVDPASVDAVEYMLGGDTAIAAMQYSYLPSWISFLVDKSKAEEAGVALFNGVYDAWSQLPAGHRPQLYIFGESLGSFGGQSAFPTLAAMADRTDGAVLAGTPNFTDLWATITEQRDAGSPERVPVYEQGRTARFAAVPPDLAQPATPWSSPRVAYLQHSSDPIVWWSPKLLFERPDWLAEPRGPDVLPAMVWLPYITFWQVTADMVHSTGVPDGHGHVYKQEYVDGWAAVTQPTGWTPADTERLRALIAKED